MLTRKHLMLFIVLLVTLSLCACGKRIIAEPLIGEEPASILTDTEPTVSEVPAEIPLSGTAGIDYTTHADTQALLDLVNQARCENGLTPLVANDQLNNAGLAHDVDMALNNFFSHTGSDGSLPWDRVSAQGYSWQTVGENIAAGYTSVQEVFDGWMNSPGHKANILNPNFKEMGLAHISGAGEWGHYWTQVFAAPWDREVTAPACP
jgi:uncharacterized protein YkwD